MGARDEGSPEGAMWREFGLRRALANMPADSPGRAVIEALLARGTLTDEEARRFKAQGLQTALANMPADAPGRAVVEHLLAAESARQSPPSRTPTGASDLTEQLERLARLHDQRQLTDAEFEAAKRKLLG